MRKISLEEDPSGREGRRMQLPESYVCTCTWCWVHARDACLMPVSALAWADVMRGPWEVQELPQRKPKTPQQLTLQYCLDKNWLFRNQEVIAQVGWAGEEGREMHSGRRGFREISCVHTEKVKQTERKADWCGGKCITRTPIHSK